jgi:predicted dehydrogenase
MRIALLGLDSDVLELTKYLVTATSHEITVAIVSGEQASLLTRIEPRFELDWAWESLIAAPEIDAVIVARGDDQELHDEQLRKLAQAGTTLVVSHPSCSPIVAYELDMIRADVGGALIPLFKGRSHPGFAQLAELITAGGEGPLGVVHRLEIERPVLDRDDVTFQRCLALDAHAAARLIGPISTVSAIGASQQDGSNDSITVHLTSAGMLQARWTATPTGEAEVRLIGSGGEATLQQTGDPSAWVLRATSESLNRDYRDWNQAAEVTEDLANAVAGTYTAMAWQDACRNLEIAETALVSLQRKRTLDVYSEPRTEVDSFKGVMAIGSCALLMLVLMTFVFLAVFEGFRLPMADPAVPNDSAGWPLALRLWPVYPLLAFLGLQLLLMVARRPKEIKSPS